MADVQETDPLSIIQVLAAESRRFPATAERNLRQIVTLALGEQRRIREARGAIQPRTTRGTR
jgi:hypothetical protein